MYSKKYKNKCNHVTTHGKSITTRQLAFNDKESGTRQTIASSPKHTFLLGARKEQKQQTA